MFNILKGAKIEKSINLVEGYIINKDQSGLITANISSEKIRKIMVDFIDSFDDEDLYIF